MENLLSAQLNENQSAVRFARPTMEFSLSLYNLYYRNEFSLKACVKYLTYFYYLTIGTSNTRLSLLNHATITVKIITK